MSCIDVYSRSSPRNPPVILWLHGSEGMGERMSAHFPIDKFLDRGYAVVTFNRFVSYTTEGEKYDNINRCQLTEGSKRVTSWGTQSSFPLSTEIIMVHRVCTELYDKGTRQIILAGFSRGAILAAACAATDVFDMFKDVGVTGYVAFGDMPVQMKPLTREIPITFISGEHDTLCPPDLMKFYRTEYLKDYSNTRLYIVPKMGHSPFPTTTTTTTLKATKEFLGEIFCRFNPRMWCQAATNYINTLRFLWLGTTGLFTQKTKRGQNLINACGSMDGDYFYPLVKLGSSFQFKDRIAKSSYPDFIKERTRSELTIKKPLISSVERDGIIEWIIGLLCPVDYSSPHTQASATSVHRLMEGVIARIPPMPYPMEKLI